MQEKWTYPRFEGNQFQDHLHGEEPSEEHVKDVHGVVEIFGLSMMLQRAQNNALISTKKGVLWESRKAQTFIRFTSSCLHLSVAPSACGTHLHGQTDGVEKDECEHQVLKVGGVDHIPHLVLVRVLGDVAAQWTRLQSVLHTLTL